MRHLPRIVATVALISSARAELPPVATAPHVSAPAVVRQAEVGHPVPEATVRDELGISHRLSEYTAGKKTVIIFYLGSACPYCVRHLRDLATLSPELITGGGRIIAVGMDAPARLRRRLAPEDYPFPLLSDSESAETTRAFGIVFKPTAEEIATYRRHDIDIEVESGRKHHLLPHPAVFITDAHGVIRFAYVNRKHKGWLDRDDILRAFNAIP